VVDYRFTGERLGQKIISVRRKYADTVGLFDELVKRVFILKTYPDQPGRHYLIDPFLHQEYLFRISVAGASLVQDYQHP
jgi:hypothetical protein